MDPLATPGELSLHLQRDVDPDRAEQALALASGAVRAYCGWDLSRETTTFEVDGSGTVVLTLPTLMLVDILEVRVLTEDGFVVMDPLRFSATKKGQLLHPAGWSVFSIIEVDCVHGYDPIPDLLKLVTLELAARAQTNPEGLASATVGQVSRTWATGGNAPRLTDLDQRLLERFRL